MMMLLLLGFGGLTAGMLGGLLGIGGGILIMPLLRFGMGFEPAYAAGTCVVAVFFTTLSGSFKHFMLGHIDFRFILPVIVSGLLSTLIFSLLFLYLSHNNRWLDLATGVVFSLVAVRMMWEGIAEYVKKRFRTESGERTKSSLLAKTTIGTAAGLLPGLLGIGTGAVLVPAFTFALNVPVKIAVGSSLACFSLNALASSLLKLSQGFVQIPVLIPLCLGTVMGARLGATLNGKMSSPSLKISFGSVFLYVAAKYLLL